jgi:threonine/homoserine/homoserine lactone efflux protein
MAVGSVLTFWAVAILLIIVPGADWAFTIGAAVRGRPVASAVGGLVIGYTAMTAVVAAGIGALLASTPTVLSALTVVGGAYLIWLGVKTLRKPPAGFTSTAHDASMPTGRATLLRGIGVSGLNPKGLLLFVALLPQFANQRWEWPLAVQLALLGLLFTATCGIFYAVMGLFARTLLHARPRAARTVSCISGASMILIGLSLLIEHLMH